MSNHTNVSSRLGYIFLLAVLANSHVNGNKVDCCKIVSAGPPELTLVTKSMPCFLLTSVVSLFWVGCNIEVLRKVIAHIRGREEVEAPRLLMLALASSTLVGSLCVCSFALFALPDTFDPGRHESTLYKRCSRYC